VRDKKPGSEVANPHAEFLNVNSASCQAGLLRASEPEPQLARHGGDFTDSTDGAAGRPRSIAYSRHPWSTDSQTVGDRAQQKTRRRAARPQAGFLNINLVS
jgi:hypothetical protein